MAKMIWQYTAEESQSVVRYAAKEAIEQAHFQGIATTHLDDKGIYLLYPDGHKEYQIEPEPENHMKEKKYA